MAHLRAMISRMPRRSALPIVIATTPWGRFVRRLLRLLGRP